MSTWRWLGLSLTLMVTLALGALIAAPRPAVGQAADPSSVRDVLAAASLTEAEMPPGLALDPSRTGLRTDPDGWPSHTATFMGDGRGDLPILGVIGVVGQTGDVATGIDRLAERFDSGLSGVRTDLPAPSIGEASRAFTVTNRVMGGSMTASTAFVALRRADVVAGVAVASLGETPQIDVALRLAQTVDRRLAAALRGGS